MVNPSSLFTDLVQPWLRFGYIAAERVLWPLAKDEMVESTGVKDGGLPSRGQRDDLFNLATFTSIP